MEEGAWESISRRGPGLKGPMRHEWLGCVVSSAPARHVNGTVCTGSHFQSARQAGIPRRTTPLDAGQYMTAEAACATQPLNQGTDEKTQRYWRC